MKKFPRWKSPNSEELRNFSPSHLRNTRAAIVTTACRKINTSARGHSRSSQIQEHAPADYLASRISQKPQGTLCPPKPGTGRTLTDKQHR